MDRRTFRGCAILYQPILYQRYRLCDRLCHHVCEEDCRWYVKLPQIMCHNVHHYRIALNFDKYIRLYNTYVRCHPEYAVQVRSPCTKQNVDNIEAVQKKAIRNCHWLLGSNLQLRGETQWGRSDNSCGPKTSWGHASDFQNPKQSWCGVDVDYWTWFKKVDEQHQMTSGCCFRRWNCCRGTDKQMLYQTARRDTAV